MDVLEHPSIAFTNSGRKDNVYIGKIEDEINTEDISSLKFKAHLKNDQQSARNPQ